MAHGPVAVLEGLEELAPPPPLAPLRPEQLTPPLFQALAWAQAVTGLDGFLGVRESDARTAIARFENGEAFLRQGPSGDYGLERVELRCPNLPRRVLFDDQLLRLAVLYRLQPFNPAQSDPHNNTWTFGTLGSNELGVASVLKGGGQLAITLQPRTRLATVLKQADYFVSPTFLAEDVLEHVDVGRVLQVEREVVRCEDADILLGKERHTGEKSRCFVATAVRFPGAWPIPVGVFHLAAQLGFGRFVVANPGDSVMFAHGSLRVQGGQIVEVRRFAEPFVPPVRRATTPMFAIPELAGDEALAAATP